MYVLFYSLARVTRQQSDTYTDWHRGGGTPIYSYICRLWSFLWGSNCEFQYLFLLGGGGVIKINIFGDMKILWIFLGGNHKIGLYLGIILGDIYLGCLNFKFIFGCLIFLILLG